MGTGRDNGFIKTRVIVDNPRLSRTNGDDRRSLSQRESLLFSGVGVVEGMGFQGGTAFIVSNCKTVVTAAHTIETESGLRTRDVAFLHRGDPATEFPIDWSNSFIPPAAGFLGRSNIQRDVAVLALQHPVPDCVPLSYATLVNDHFDAYRNRIYSISFHRDTGQDAVIHRNCSILNNEVDRDALLRSGYRLDPLGRQDSVILHDCDTASGSSGSPLVIFAGDTPYVVGINTGNPGRPNGSDIPMVRGDDGFLPERLRRMYPNHGVLFSEMSAVVEVLDRQLQR